MNTELTPEEKLQIEREFVARQELEAKRRLFYRRVFLIGISAGIMSSLLRVFIGGGTMYLFLLIIWIVCAVIYTGGRTFPRTLSQDMDIRWQLNPWRDALQNLAAGCRQAEVIALLATPLIVRWLSAFAYFSFK
jgi:hypothetical protein